MNIDDKMGQYSEGQTEEAERGALEIFSQFGKLVGTPPDSFAAQALAKKWQEHINKYYYECPDEIYAVVGQFYPTDENFVKFTDGFGKGTAQFMSDVIAAYCDKDK